MDEREVPWGEGKYFKTKSSYLNWIRGALRSSWTRYPPQNILKASRSVRVPVLDANREKTYYKTGKKKGQLKTRLESPCDECGKVFPSGKVQVDHIVPAGKFTEEDHIKDFVLNLFGDVSNWQLLCIECHELKSFMESYGYTDKEEAKKAKEVIAKCKQKVPAQKKELMKAGFTEAEVSNQEKRKECYRRLLGA